MVLGECACVRRLDYLPIGARISSHQETPFLFSRDWPAQKFHSLQHPPAMDELDADTSSFKQTAKDLFAGAAGGIAQVLIGMCCSIRVHGTTVIPKKTNWGRYQRYLTLIFLPMLWRLSEKERH